MAEFASRRCNRVCVCVCRLRSGEGLYNARLHVEAWEPLPDSVAAPVLLPLPEPSGVERRGRVTGESASHAHVQGDVLLFVCQGMNCLSVSKLHTEGEVAKTF